MSSSNIVVYIGIASIALLLISALYSSRQFVNTPSSQNEKYVLMPAAYLTPDIVKIAKQGGPHYKLRATNLPENWVGWLENEKGDPYVSDTNPYKYVYPTKLVKAFVDKNNNFQCYYNTTIKNLNGRVTVGLDKDCSTRPTMCGSGVIVRENAKKQGCYPESWGHLLQPPSCYDPEVYEETVMCPNPNAFEFSSQFYFK